MNEQQARDHAERLSKESPGTMFFVLQSKTDPTQHIVSQCSKYGWLTITWFFVSRSPLPS